MKKKTSGEGFTFLSEEEMDIEREKGQAEDALYGEGENAGGGGGSGSSDNESRKKKYAPRGSFAGVQASVERDQGRTRVSREKIEKIVKKVK